MIKNKLFYKEIDASIDIDATPEKVWEVLLDFESWGTWNDFIPMVKGDLSVGKSLTIKVISPGLKPMIFKPQIYEVIPYQKILWGGSFLKILYRGDHAFLLESTQKEKTRFRQIERFMGPMTLFMNNMIEKTEKGYEQMNRALKKKAENKI